MSEYHKIQSVFLRDPGNNFKTFLPGQYTCPEFEYLKDCDWDWTEKVDGTNVRVIVGDGGVEFRGKTDRAQMPPGLLKRLGEIFNGRDLGEQFPDGAVLYGEGFGPKIQKGGGLYGDHQDFVLFDVRVGKWWLERSAVSEIAKSLDIQIVPLVGVGGLIAAISYTREGFESQWGRFRAEGLVLRPSTTLQSRSGDRIITKVKCKDFDGEAK